MILIVILIGAGLAALSHSAPFPFLLESLGPGRSVWHMPRSDGAPTIYLTFDDGPNAGTTPALLDVLANEGATATFFVIPAHVTPETAPIVARARAEGHAIALHADSRALMLLSPDALVSRLEDDAAHIATLAGAPPCRLFRPHAGWRGGPMYEGLDRAGYTLAGWSFGMWDWNWWRPPDAENLATRLAARASDGDIVVMHDGQHDDPDADRRYTVEATARLVPELVARGFAFGHVCDVAR